MRHCIPTRPCVFCKKATNECQSKFGVSHQRCYDDYIIKQQRDKE